MPKEAHLMKIALSSALPPWTTPVSAHASSLLAALQENGTAHALVDTPWRIRPGLVARDQLHSLCDLPTLLDQNVIDMPIYMVGDDALHLHQLRYVQKVPGLFVFLGVTPRDQDYTKVAQNHSPLFFADESALPVGVKVMTNLALDYLFGGK